MNLVDSTVKEIDYPPYEKYGKWWVDVISDCWGQQFGTSLMFDTKEEAQQVKVGYKHLS